MMRAMPNLTVLVNTSYRPPIFNCFVKGAGRWGAPRNDSNKTCR